MKHLPKVSVVIPAHNEQHYIAKTLKAISALDYPDFEVIVVANACTDRTADIAASFPNVIVVTEPRKGTHAAREAGRRIATGQIIASVDADCLPSADWLKKGVDLMTDDFIAVSGPCYFYDETKFFNTASHYVQKTLYRPTNQVMSHFGKGGVLPTANCLIRSEVLEHIGGYNTDITFYGDDADTAKRLAAQGKILYSPEFIMLTSARRFQEQGNLKTVALYIFYYIRVVFRFHS